MLALCLAGAVSLFGGVQLQIISVTTNIPPFDFTAAAGTTAYWMDKKYCQTVTFTITGEPGVYDLQWNYALGNPRTNVFSPTNTVIEGHGFLNVYPPITNTGTVTVTFPANPSPESFWRLKKR